MNSTMHKIPDLFCLENYTFDLPEKQIAQFPKAKRSSSKLMVLSREQDRIEDTCFHNLLSYLPEKSILVINTSRVASARLIGCREGSPGEIEFLLLTPVPLIVQTLGPGWQEASVEGLLRPAKKVKPGQLVRFSEHLFIRIKSKEDFGRVQATLHWKGDLGKRIEGNGVLPLPPYIKRMSDKEDADRYQTVYARSEYTGSVAAPTAGLHFDQELLDKLGSKRIEIVPLNLYVGYGTFSPIRCRDIREHVLHSEYAHLSCESAQKIRAAAELGRAVVAVGTTSARTLEGIWEQQGRIDPYAGWLNTYIYPGHRFRVVDLLLTNFHLPQSSLLVMVAAFAGRERILRAYHHAVEHEYRFFSYGDAMLIL